MYDLLFRQATIYDGSGSEPYTGDLAVEGDTIAAAGPPGRCPRPPPRQSLHIPWWL